MKLPYNRPHLLEVHDQPFCPPFIRAQCQAILSFLWTHRILPFQFVPPSDGTADVLEGLVNVMEEELKDGHYPDNDDELRIVDFCSGAGGPMPAIERRLNDRRLVDGKPVVPVVMSDLHPHIPAWTRAASDPSSHALSFISSPVDATRSRNGLSKGKHIRTFCLSFHHFNEDNARQVLQDAMKSAEGICIFELQQPDLSSLILILTVFPLVFLVTPFTRPSLSVLFWTYIIPLIPFIMMFDGFISVYRTRSLDHIKHLANLASMVLSLEGSEKEAGEWRWVEGRRRHTWPVGHMFYILGRRVTSVDDGG